MGRNWEKALIISYNGLSQPNNHSDTERCQQIKKTIKDYLDTNDSGLALGHISRHMEDAETLNTLFREVEAVQDHFTEIVRAGQLQDRAPYLYKIAEMDWRNLLSNPNYHEILFDRYLGNKTPQSIMKEALTLPEPKLFYALRIYGKNKGASSSQKGIQNKVEIHMGIYRTLFDEGILLTRFPQEVMGILEAYQNIQKTRNQINHASKMVTADNEKVKSMMLDCLDRIDNCLRAGNRSRS